MFNWDDNTCCIHMTLNICLRRLDDGWCHMCLHGFCVVQCFVFMNYYIFYMRLKFSIYRVRGWVKCFHDCYGFHVVWIRGCLEYLRACCLPWFRLLLVVTYLCRCFPQILYIVFRYLSTFPWRLFVVCTFVCISCIRNLKCPSSRTV